MGSEVDLVLSVEMGTALPGVSWGCRGSACSEALARALPPFANVLQEVPAGGSSPFPAQNPISEAHWAPGIGPESHSRPQRVWREAKVLSFPGKSHFARVLLFPNNLYKSAKLHPTFLWHRFPSELHPGSACLSPLR